MTPGFTSFILLFDQLLKTEPQIKQKNLSYIDSNGTQGYFDYFSSHQSQAKRQPNQVVKYFICIENFFAVYVYVEKQMAAGAPCTFQPSAFPHSYLLTYIEIHGSQRIENQLSVNDERKIESKVWNSQQSTWDN